jgi:Ankyrin repeats (many copies)
LNEKTEYEENYNEELGDTEEDDEYMTKQEKLWNMIETKQPIDEIQSLLECSEEDGEIDIDAKNVFEDGWTCLHYAVHESYFPLIKILIPG